MLPVASTNYTPYGNMLQLITSVNSITSIKDMYMTHTGTLHVANQQSARTVSVAFGEPGSRLTTSASRRQANNLKVGPAAC